MTAPLVTETPGAIPEQMRHIGWAMKCRVPVAEKAALLVLAAHVDADGVAAVPLAMLAGYAGLSRKSLHDALGRLHAWGFISTLQRTSPPPVAWRLNADRDHCDELPAAELPKVLPGFARFDPETGRLTVSDELRSALMAGFPTVDVTAELRKVEGWFAQNATRRTSNAAMVVAGWMRRAAAREAKT